MGIYYNPLPPHIGAQQPLEQRKLTPPSGPLPQNPPFNGGAKIAQAIIMGWSALVVTNAIAPVTARNLTPQNAVNNPPFTGARVPLEIQINWPPPLAVIELSFSTPLPGAAVQPVYVRQNVDILNAWLPPVPAPIVAINLDPPVSGPTPQNPPVIGSRVPLAVQVAWLPLPPSPIVAVNLDPPQSAPAGFFPYIGSVVTTPVLISWLPSAPMPIVGPKFTLGGAVPSNPPFMGGARVRNEVLINWLPPIPAPIVGTNLTNGVAGMTLTLSTTENPDLVSFTVTFRDVWVASIKQDEIWTPAIKQDETWTPK